MPVYLCPVCEKKHPTLKLHRKHVSDIHVKGLTHLRFTCRHCDKKKNISYDWYRRHIAKCVPENDQPLEEESQLQLYMDHDFDSMEVDEEMPVFQQDHIHEVLDNIKEMFDSLWLSLLSSPGVTNHTVDIVCGIVSDMLQKSLDLLKPFPSDYEKAVTYFSQEWSKTKTEYLRKQELYKSGDFIQPEKYALNDRLEPVATFDGQYLRLKTDYMAVIPLEMTLQRLLQCESFRNKLLMPSMFFEKEISTHPFCSQRAADLFELVGEDYIAIQLYDDDFGTTNPLQSSSASFYKMDGCYYRILNLPAEFQSTFEHMFLAYLAYSNDMAMNRQRFLRATVIQQLRQLENEGITVLINGRQIQYPVVLFNLVGDNLGLNQNGGYQSYFLGDNACRICHFTWEEICSTFQMTDDRLRTVEGYDEAAMSEDLAVRKAWGIKEPSAFNDLELFHVQECPSVDLMHDLFQGHVRYLIPLIFSSFENYENVFNAVSTFPFQGKDSFNIPRPTQNGDRIEVLTGMTAATLSTFVRLLPLILADLIDEEGNELWNLLILFQKIYDIVMAQHADEEMVDSLTALIEEYLTEFKRKGGHITVKPHYMTHYPRMIRMYGPLRFSWSMRYEAMHQPFKQYSNVNRCHKNLPYTLSWKHQAFACSTVRKMEKADYFDKCLSRTYGNLYKIGDIVVIGKDNGIPQFGRVYVKQNNDYLGIYKLMTESFDEIRHCYKVISTTDIISVHPSKFLINESMRLYFNTYVRIPYALPW